MQVLIPPKDVAKGSRCTRCLEPIPLDKKEEFLRNDHLCDNCSGESDSAHAQRVIESERQPTVRQKVAP